MWTRTGGYEFARKTCREIRLVFERLKGLLALSWIDVILLPWVRTRISGDEGPGQPCFRLRPGLYAMGRRRSSWQ